MEKEKMEDEPTKEEFDCYFCNCERNMEDFEYWSEYPCIYEEMYQQGFCSCPAELYRRIREK